MIKCVAIDDEPIALSIIQEHCRRFGGFSLRCFSSPSEGLEYIKADPPQILFLDIEMMSYNGIEIAKHLPPEIILIFTTAYAQYAIDGYNLNAIDFLHKPIFYPRFEQAIAKAKRWLKAEQSAIHAPASVTLKAGHQNVVVGLDSITYIEAMDNYVKIFRDGLPTILSQLPMKELVTQLPEDRFIRVHRSYIIPTGRVLSYTGKEIRISGVSKLIPIGRTYLPLFRQLSELRQR